jgi:hypothetical protein
MCMMKENVRYTCLVYMYQTKSRLSVYTNDEWANSSVGKRKHMLSAIWSDKQPAKTVKRHRWKEVSISTYN